jgi:hypothetical protein
MVKLIDTLRNMKIPLKEIKALVQKRNIESITQLFSSQERQLNSELRKVCDALTLIGTLRFLLQDAIPRNEQDIVFEYRESRRITLGPINDFQGEEDYYRGFAKFYRFATKFKLNKSYPIGGYFNSFEDFCASPSRPTRFFLIDPDGRDKSPAGQYLLTYQRGGYGSVGELPARLKTFAENQALDLKGPIYQIYPINELHAMSSDDYLLETSIFLKPQRIRG